MFVCRGCLRSLTGTSASPLGPRLLGPLQRTAASVSSRRMYTGKGIKADLRSTIADPIQPGERRFSSKGKGAADEKNPGEDGEDLGYENINPKGGELGRQKYEKRLEASVKRQLSLTTDPYHIALHVARVLEKGNFDEALMTARMASRNTKVEVSWNHLIDYQMKNRRLHAAVKLYNEMKKRAQIPNAKTYTIIFRGCAQSLHPKLAVAEATRIYNFMIKYGPLKPNTIHMNAVLEVCARAGDLESLFTVLATCNGSIRSADAHTYTIVLNALRYDAGTADKANLGLVDTEVKREIQKNIQRARAIWTDVIANWRSAKMIIDEHLVSAMGRILALGDYKDNDSVLELLEQTMKIPRFDKLNVKLPDAPAAAATGEADATAVPENQAPDTDNMSPKARKVLAGSRANKSPLYAKPGNKTLSLVLTVLAATRKTSSAAKYWSYFTDILHVKPDPQNHSWYLRALATGHASGQVAALIASMPSDLLTPLTFRRGFSACISDNLNQHAFKHACRIFDVMATKQRYPDALAMRLFLQVARANTRHFHEPPQTPSEAKEQDTPTGKPAHGAQIIAALDRMWEPFRILTGSLSYPAAAAAEQQAPTARSPQEELDQKRGDMQEISATARRMIAAIDRVVNDEGMADRRTGKLWRTRRIILQKLLERYLRVMYPNGPPPREEEERERRAVLDEEEGFEGRSSRRRQASSF
ncbi:hypothetical protein C8A01DRAFT_32595 [Parachaetomium inaequale]|uniref:Pentatricopeptide repeat protein n=1 Tax=Parachaetomium inaequale TaxID=2588326 RepID=A0AAN6PLJ5_9PEZI|nr:hypothetical protein C8A01DRAFT_32595 [Parachaetomium inaequale]